LIGRIVETAVDCVNEEKKKLRLNYNFVVNNKKTKIWSYS
jgi:hypothetical protein